MSERMEELRRVLDAHDPGKQGPGKQGHGYQRCELCNMTRHPCDAYSAAEEGIAEANALTAERDRLREEVERLKADNSRLRAEWRSARADAALGS
jgi:hypothetical protein